MSELIVNLDNEKITNDFGATLSELIKEGDINSDKVAPKS